MMLTGGRGFERKKRQSNQERRPTPLFAVQGDLPAVSIDHILDDLGSQTRTAHLPTDRLSGEETVADVRRHASAGVSHRQKSHAGRRLESAANRNGAPGWNLRDRVIDQIIERVGGAYHPPKATARIQDPRFGSRLP